eukprot:1831931-Amphidinium_carterae.1
MHRTATESVHTLTVTGKSTMPSSFTSALMQMPSELALELISTQCSSDSPVASLTTVPQHSCHGI